MTISDIITLVSLAIAIIAILSEKNRNHLLFKFHIVDYILFLLCFGLINYFVFYESFFTRGLYISQLYTNWGLKNPKNYAYLISIGILIYFFYKIWYAFYPYSKLQRVMSFYSRLIENNEIPFLLDIIDRYHKIDIIKAVEQTKDYDTKDDIRQLRFHKETSKEKVKRRLNEVIKFLFPYSWQNRKIYGVNVLYNILNDHAFMVLASNQRPYLFADIFSHFKKSKRDGFPKELVNLFLSELIHQKQFWLKRELQDSQNHDTGQPEWFFENNRILAALIQDLSVADVNEVWRPFGEAAIHEIEDERNLGYESKMFKEFKEKQFLWEYRTYFSIQGSI
ncbi:MAG: hypothetical protein H3C48_15385 [Chitinophagaceae bacterium]|nr:hypothetical protein [Chitinophagaceae bacterium]